MLASILLLLLFIMGKLLIKGVAQTNHLILSDTYNENKLPTLQFGDSSDNICQLYYENSSLKIKSKDVEVAKFIGGENPQLELENLVINNQLDLQSTLRINGVAQWSLIHIEFFEMNKAPQGWDNTNANIVTQCAGITMLGGYEKFSKGEIAKTFKIGHAHKYLKVIATVHFIDRWNGETFFARASVGKDGSLVYIWNESYVEKSKGVNICGNSSPDSNFMKTVTIIIPHVTTEITLSFGTTIELDLPSELSWGISSIELFII